MSESTEKALSREVLTQVLLAHYPVSMSYCRCSYEAEPMVWWTPDHVADVLGFPPGSEGQS